MPDTTERCFQMFAVSKGEEGHFLSGQLPVCGLPRRVAACYPGKCVPRGRCIGPSRLTALETHPKLRVDLRLVDGPTPGRCLVKGGWMLNPRSLVVLHVWTLTACIRTHIIHCSLQ